MSKKPIDPAVVLEFVSTVRGLSRKSTDDKRYLTGTVTHTDPDGTVWVSVAGGVGAMPVTRSTASYSPGDVVSFSIEDGVASMGGNVTDPAAGGDKVVNVTKHVNFVENQLTVTQNIVAGKAEIADLNAARATIGELQAADVTITGQLTAATGRIGTLESDNVAVKGRLDAAEADIDDLEAEDARIGNLVATKADITDLTAATGRITTLESTKANISDLEANYITAATIEAQYMHANMSNSDVAWIQNGVIKDGAISSAMINTLSANKIVGGTADFSKMNVVNLKAENIEVDRINGQPVTGKTVVDALTQHESDISDLDSKLDDAVDDLQGQIDGAIETWTGTEVPTLLNTPASAWTTDDDRRKHVGDVYFVVNSNSQQNGYNYRFTKTGNEYSWQLIKDSDVTNALQRLTTAEGKISTFDSDISTLKTDTGEIKTKTQSLETSLGDKVDTTTFNELEDTVDGHSQTISQHTTAISQKADTSTVNQVTNRVTKAEQDISGINTTIGQLQTTVEGKADGSTVTTISNKLNTVSDTVDGHTQTISSVQSTLSSKADNSTVATLRSEYNETKTTVSGHETRLGATERVANGVRTDLDNLEIGGRNLLKGTADITGDVGGGGVTEWGTDSMFGGVKTAKTQSSWSGIYMRLANIADVMVAGEKYTASVYVKTDEDRDVPFTAHRFTHKTNVGDGSLGTHSLQAGVWEQLSITFTATEGDDSSKTTTSARIESSQAVPLWWAAPKLERGNKATDWTPAPEDLEIEVTSLKTDYANYKQTTTEALSEIGTTYATKTELGTETSNRQTAIQQLNNAISLKANSSDVYTKTQTDGLISTEVTNRNAAITAKADEITSSVSETYATKSTVNGIEGRVSTAESTITQQAGQIEAKVSKDGVIAAINLSTETEGGSAVKISADKVNIEGAAIFTGSGRLSQSSLNNAYDAAGSASAAQAAAISAAASDATSKANAAEANAKAAIPTDISGLNNDAGYQTSSDVSAAISTGTANLAAKADAVARTQRIYYRQTASGSAPGVNNTWLSTSGTGYGNWSLSIPQLTNGTTKYPKLYMATQTQTVAQKAAGSICTCTTPALDDSTTIIDGGNIITGSVTANQLSANSVTADKIASNAITVGKMPSSDQASILNSNVTIGNVNGLQDALNGKETAGAAAAVQQTLEATIDGVAQDVQNKADSASLDSTNDDLTQLVAGLSTSDHFNVNDDGTYTFGLDEALDGVEAKAAQDLSDSERVLNDKIDANVTDLQSKIDEASQANLYIHFDEASDGLEIGKNLDGTAGAFRQLMDDQGTHWQYNREDAAYVGVNDEGKGTMFLDEAQVTGRLRVGNYIFMGNDAGTRMSLKWIGD